MDAGILWTLPKEDFIKADVHGVFFEEPLPNGNTSGIGVVFRDDRGTIIKMYAGTLRIEGRRINEFSAMLYALRKDFFLEYNRLELDTDHQEAYWAWRFSNGDGVIPEHQYVVRQLNTRREDKNFRIDVNLVNEDCNTLASYLANHGAHTLDYMVEIQNLFGRVREIWYNDMGLGPIGPQFDTVRENELNAAIDNNEDELEVLDDDDMM